MRISLGILVVCGLASGWLLARVVPDGLVEQCHRDVVTRPFELTRQVAVSEGNWFFLPQLWGDFELLLALEVGPGAAVDILLRQVEKYLEPQWKRLEALEQKLSDAEKKRPKTRQVRSKRIQQAEENTEPSY